MTIATYSTTDAIAQPYFSPVAYDGVNWPFPNVRPGSSVFGDAGAEYTPCVLYVYTALTVNQGDVFLFDNSFTCYPCTTAAALRGMWVGTAFFGASLGLTTSPGSSTAAGAPWQYVLPVGNYIIWLQTSGSSILNQKTTTVANTYVCATTTTAGVIEALQTPTSGSKNILNMYSPAVSGTFTGTTVTGSPNITATTSLFGARVGMKITGTGIPNNCYIKQINGATVTLGNNVASGSALCTASASVTVTWANNSFTANLVTATATLTNISNLAGVYPNATLSGTGILAATTITSIQGAATGSPVIYLSQNVTATGTSTTITPQFYIEGWLNNPQIDTTN